jgi:DNA (cytosine-5)-methyltransferase 1
VATAEIDKYAVISYASIHHGLEDKIQQFKIQLDKNNINVDFDKLKEKLQEKGYKKISKKEIITLYIADKISKNIGNITKVNPNELPDFDLFTYSTPCQDISIAGKMKGLQEGSETRSSLLWQCKKIIEIKKPKYLMLENVKNLVGKKFKRDFDKWLSVLEELGYNNHWKILNAKDYGIPQNRERVFVVSIRKDIDNKCFKFSKPQDLIIRVNDLLENQVEEKFYYSKERAGKLIKILEKKGMKLNTDKLDHVGDIDLHGYDYLKRVYNENGLSPTISTCGGGHREPKIACCPLPREYNGFKDISPTLCARDYKDPKTVITFDERSDEGVRFFKNDTIGTIRTIDAGGDKRVYENFSIRKLTPKECWRLMGFDDSDFDKASIFNSDTQLYKQAGNSIVINVLEEIFKQLLINNKYKQERVICKEDLKL